MPNKAHEGELPVAIVCAPSHNQAAVFAHTKDTTVAFEICWKTTPTDADREFAHEVLSRVFAPGAEAIDAGMYNDRAERKQAIQAFLNSDNQEPS